MISADEARNNTEAARTRIIAERSTDMRLRIGRMVRAAAERGEYQITGTMLDTDRLVFESLWDELCAAGYYVSIDIPGNVCLRWDDKPLIVEV